MSKPKSNTIFKDLPVSLKDPKCFEEIETRLSRILFSDHKHKTIKAYMACGRCQTKFNKRKETIRELGFKDYPQYVEWKKVMVIANSDMFKHAKK